MSSEYTQNDSIRSKKMQEAALAGIIGNGVLALLKLVAGIYSGSFSVMADGIDSLSDMATNAVSWVTARIIQRPPDPKYPFGYRRAEAVGTKLLAYLIVFVGIELAWESGKNLWYGQFDPPENLGLLIGIMSLSLLFKLILAVWQGKTARRTQSNLLRASSMNMWNDLLISALVLSGLALNALGFWPQTDAILGCLVALWILYIGIRFIIESSGELMDGVHNPEVYTSIQKAVDLVKGAENPHRIRVRKMGHLLAVDLDIEVDGRMSVDDSHELAVQTEYHIKRLVPNVYDIMVHIEPIGNTEPGEKFGVSAEDL